MKIARVATVPFSLLGSRNVLRFLSNKEDLYVVCSQGDYQEDIQANLKNKIINLNINRHISPIADIVSIIKLYFLFKDKQFEIVHSNTPKGGLIAAIASYIAGVPLRCHTFTGQRWATLTGFKKILLQKCDWLICLLNTHVYADSESQVKFLEENGIANPRRIKCLGKGGFAGIDLNRFNKENISSEKIEGLDESGLVIGFVGRVVREKGIGELVRAFKSLREKGQNISLVLIGPFEPDLDPIEPEVLEVLKNDKNIFKLGYMPHPEKALCQTDLLCLPSYREGFPMVVLEAGALGIPSVVSRIPGNIDTILEGETGLSFELKSKSDLEDAIGKLYNDRKLLSDMGKKAKERVENYYSDSIIQNLFYEEYQTIGKS